MAKKVTSLIHSIGIGIIKLIESPFIANEHKRQRLMQEFCSGRPLSNLEEIYSKQFQSLVGRKNFIKLWSQIAENLRYPTPESMHLDDKLDDVIELNNEGVLWSLLCCVADFDDVYEVLEVVNVKYFYLAVDNQIELTCVSDLLDFICSNFDLRESEAQEDKSSRDHQ